ncbi:hypothetical protein [Parasediminibacterium sp. JCM 36343]|uniref:hypothetical protein n=1 Tax=Parasediminibacterium sp. JCM 36343 TaxID=3374279 RepID=UPI00397BAB7D
MKKILFALVLLYSSTYCFAQDESKDSTTHHARKDEEDEPGFDKSRIFAGGGISLGYGTTNNGDYTTTTSFNIGAIPEIGYSVSELLDVGIATSINYYSVSNSQYTNTKQHTVNTSLGAFLRVHPFNNFFIQAMPEIDWSSNKIIYNDQSGKYSYHSNSFLVGIGYGQRIIGQSYFYTLLMIDLLKERNSPYVDYTGQVLPVLRGGFNFYPFRKSR